MRLRYILETIIDTDSPMLLPDMVRKLSHHQRAFLIAHCETGFLPYRNEPMENTTRRSLIIRKLIEYEPHMPGRLGKPDGTVLTFDGHDAACMVLGEMADQLMQAIAYAPIAEERQRLLHDALAECARHWRNENRRHNFP